MSEAWELARAAARGAGVELRPLPTVEDADRINDVIQATWGGQRIDREVVRALAESGNVPWGAFDGDRAVGFVLGWAGMDGEACTCTRTCSLRCRTGGTAASATR